MNYSLKKNKTIGRKILTVQTKFNTHIAKEGNKLNDLHFFKLQLKIRKRNPFKSK